MSVFVIDHFTDAVCPESDVDHGLVVQNGPTVETECRFQHVFVDITVIVGFEFVPFSADRDSVSIFSSCVDRN